MQHSLLTSCGQTTGLGSHPCHGVPVDATPTLVPHEPSCDAYNCDNKKMYGIKSVKNFKTCDIPDREWCAGISIALCRGARPGHEQEHWQC